MMDERVADDLAEAFDDGYERGYADGVCAIKADYEELIERDKPKKPTQIRKTEGVTIGKCKVCGRSVRLSRMAQICGAEWLFCPTCGNRIGWSEL